MHAISLERPGPPLRKARDKQGEFSTIIVIETNHRIGDMISWALELYGYSAVSLAKLGREELEEVLADLVLLDRGMSETKAALDALQCFRFRWKAVSVCPIPPVVLLTTNALLELNTIPVLLKPFHLTALYNTVQKVIGQSPELAVERRAQLG